MKTIQPVNYNLFWVKRTQQKQANDAWIVYKKIVIAWYWYDLIPYKTQEIIIYTQNSLASNNFSDAHSNERKNIIVKPRILIKSF